jgi:integrase
MPTKAKSKKRIGSARPVPTGEPGRYELRVSGGPDSARPGKYLLHRKVIGPLNRKGRPLTEKDLDIELAAFVTDVLAGRLPKTGMTFGELLDKYLAALDIQERQNSTLRTYRGLIRRWLRPHLGDVPVAQLTPLHFDRVYAAMRADGRAASTINQAHAVARKACNLAMNWGFLTANPTRGTIRPTVRKPKRVPATVPDLLRTVRFASEEDEALGVFIFLAAGTGARRGELVGLQWPDVDWDENRVHIQRAIGRDDDGSRIDEPAYEKTYGEIDIEVKDPKDFQDRFVDVPILVMHALRILRETIEERATWARVVLAADAYIFSGQADGSAPWKPDYPTAAFARARTKAKAPTLTLKGTRHLLGSTLHHKGIEISVIQDVLGHGSKTTTLDFYVDSVPGAGRQAAQVLSDALDMESWFDAMNIDLPDPDESDGAESGVA